MKPYIEFYYGKDCLRLITDVKGRGGTWTTEGDNEYGEGKVHLTPTGILTNFELDFINHHHEEFFGTLVSYLEGEYD